MTEEKKRIHASKLQPGSLVIAGLFSFSLVLGRHICVHSPYDGLITDNYIKPYSRTDLLLFVFFTAACYFAVAALRKWVRNRGLGIRYDGPVLSGKESTGSFVGIWLLLFFGWLPYLFRYYPGFIFPDSLNSIQQALGQIPLNNRNPLLFTMCLRFCFTITGAAQKADITSGCVLFTVLQMLLMSAGFSYSLLWCRARLKIRKVWILLLFLLCMVNPYIAADSIAMWKDPLFASALVMWSLLLTDYSLSDQSTEKKSWWIAFFLLGLFLLFWRNNGFTAVLAVAVFLAIYSFQNRKKQKEPVKKLFCLTLLLLCIWGIVTVPGYKLIGVGTPKEESAGIMINQMARVVACEGEMSEEDRAFMDELLPLEAYQEAYRPCCVDLLKWDGRFQYDALRGHRLLKTWFSMLMKNPRLYFEAWEMETYGFWTVNRPEILCSSRNISSGNPNNLSADGVLPVGDKTITFRSYLKASFWNQLLPTDFWSVPLGIVNWILVLSGICFLSCRKPKLLLLILPSLGTAAGMILASPIWYLARYGAGSQFLLPIVILVILSSAEKEKEAAAAV